MRKLAALLAILGVGLALAGAALAVPPVHHTDSEDYNGAGDCGSFQDVYVGHLDAAITSTYDKAGNAVRDIIHISGWETNYRSDMPSVSITAHRNFNVIFDYASQTEYDHGNIYTQTLPGRGVLFHDVGLISFAPDGTVVVHGPHNTFDEGDAAFCNALIAATP